MKFSALAGTAIAFTLCGFGVDPAAAEDRFGAPAMGESESPDDDLAHSESPDAADVGAEDPDRMVVGAEDPDAPGLVTGARGADAEPGIAISPDASMGHAEDVDSLPDAAAQDAAARRADERAVEAQDGVRVQTQIESIHDAKLAVTTAKERVARANAAYDNMMATDYPRGDARQRIIDERNLAHEGLAAAEKRYDQILRGPASTE